MEKTYPISIAGIKNIGTEKWLKCYYIPVTGKEFQTIYNDVFTSYIDVVKQYNNDVVYWIAISNTKNILNAIAELILEVLRLIRLKERGYEYVIGKEKVRIPKDISIYEYKFLAKINLIGKDVSGLDFKERFENVIRTIRYNSPPPVFAINNFITNISSPVFFIGDRSQQEVVAYCQQNKISPIHLPPMLFANNSYEKVDKDPDINEVLGFVCRFLALIKKQFPAIDSSIFELLRKEIDECFRYSLLLFRQNVNVLSKLGHNKLLATGLGKQTHKIFMASCRYAGGDVVGFAHGNNFCGVYTLGSFHMLSLVNQYVTVSAGHKDILQKTAKDSSFGLRIGNITFIKQSHYRRLFTELQRKKPVNRIKKIMLVGYPMYDLYFPFLAGGYAFAQFDLMVGLMKLLRSNGYYVIYKPHPLTLNKAEGLFDGYADEVIKPRFEEVFDRADCIMFSNHATSTFGFSLLTNKPIVLIEVKGNSRHPRAFELIKQRCSVVEVEEVDGKIRFDKKEVLAAVEDSLENINYDLLYEFAF